MLNNPLPRHERRSGTVAIRSDVYPANVEFSFGTNPYPKTRAIVTADEVIVLVEDGRPPGVLYRERLEDVTGTRTALQAVTADGTVTITRQGGCGCGSTLKNYRPFDRSVALARR
jgi:hypothetical protein